MSLTNCGTEVHYPGTAKKMLVNDGNIMSLALAVGAEDSIAAVSSIQRDADILQAAYGDRLSSKKEAAKEYPSLEEIVAADPDVYVAGWGYGFSEDKGITPQALKQHGIESYILTESCRQSDGAKRGVTDPYDAVRQDLKNLGILTGHEDQADAAIRDFDSRLSALQQAPSAEKKPVVMVFDSGTDTVFTSGRFGAPQGILDASGAKNATESVDDTWTTVSWELIAEQQPDAFAFVEYPGETLEQKIAALKSNPVTKDLEAVKNNRFINLPYAMWCESPLNVDAAEHVRQGLEKFGLLPASGVTPRLQLPASVPQPAA